MHDGLVRGQRQQHPDWCEQRSGQHPDALIAASQPPTGQQQHREQHDAVVGECDRCGMQPVGVLAEVVDLQEVAGVTFGKPGAPTDMAEGGQAARVGECGHEVVSRP